MHPKLPDRDPQQGFTRRRALAGAAFFGVGIGLDRLFLDRGSENEGQQSALKDSARAVPFNGSRQAGIATPAQEFLNFAAYDVTAIDAAELLQLLQVWSAAAAALTVGRPYGSDTSEFTQGPVDTGEAIGIGPSRLTITFGFGPSLFESGGRERFGIGRLRPRALDPLPPFRGDLLDRQKSDGDICVQACADNPQVAFHAIHLITRLAEPAATLRWQQLGFGRTSSTSRSQATPRNLMGFKDGTDNIRAEDGAAMENDVWAQPGDGPAWMNGGSYLIARRIQILFDVWDSTSLDGQERVIGREKLSGAPLGAKHEYDPVDLDVRRDGEPVIPADAHIRLASPHYNHGQRILRRGYSYSEPPEPGSGQIDAGLFFICFQRDPRRQFIPLQRRLAASDALNYHTLHTASAIFACPSGAERGGFVGEGLFA